MSLIIYFPPTATKGFFCSFLLKFNSLLIQLTSRAIFFFLILLIPGSCTKLSMKVSLDSFRNESFAPFFFSQVLSPWVCLLSCHGESLEDFGSVFSRPFLKCLKRTRVYVLDKKQGQLQGEMDNLSKSCLRKSGRALLGQWRLALEQTSTPHLPDSCMEQGCVAT